MSIYKKMYYHLFNVITDALEADNPDDIKRLLIKGQQETEEMYISSDEEDKNA